MDCNERGMALVSVIIILGILLTMAHILCEKVWQSIHQVSAAASREQVYWAAQSGIEAARNRLASTYVSSANWRNYLLSTSGRNYPSTPAWSYDFSGVAVDVYLRDNPDGDADPQTDNDLKIFVLARARDSLGVEAIVESLCGLDPLSAGRPWSPGRSENQQPLDVSGRPFSTYSIAE